MLFLIITTTCCMQLQFEALLVHGLSIEFAEYLGFRSSESTTDSLQHSLSECSVTEPYCEFRLHLSEAITGSVSFHIEPGTSHIMMSSSTDDITYTTRLQYNAVTAGDCMDNALRSKRFDGVAVQNARYFYVKFESCSVLQPRNISDSIILMQLQPQ